MRLPWILALAIVPVVMADEGMWTFDNFPSKTVQQKYGFAPTKEWLDHVRLASVRLAEGCSASFVSPNGLVLTNHHCAAGCIQQISSAEKDYSASGFSAESAGKEVKCPTQEANVLMEITDVTSRIEPKTKGLSDQAAREVRKAEIATIEKECASSADVRCEVIALYGGGIYDLYKYRRYQDVRLVFAPETAIAFFGGDPDNFNFPRYDLDLTFLRIYENGSPLKTENYFRVSPTGAKEGELTFVSGNPGGTNRQHTIAMLEDERDFTNLHRLLYLAEWRGMLAQFAARGDEQRRISEDEFLLVENSLKAVKGEEESLLNKSFFDQLRANEREFRQRVDANPDLRKQYADSWNDIAAAIAKVPRYYFSYTYLERGYGFRSELYVHARRLVRAAEEFPKPNEKRLEQYTDARKPEITQALTSAAPIYPAFEIEELTWSLTKLREVLGADDPTVKAVFGKRSPREIATEAVNGTSLKDLEVRKKLLEAGKAGIDASQDPMIQLARTVDPFARAARKHYEDEIESVVSRNEERIAKARFAIYGTSIYPDATFTLRLSYGTVKGWNENGVPVRPFTTLGGAFERATGRFPFALPQSWTNAKSKLNLDTPFNFVTDNDIIGGNSGSPVIDRNAQLVGLIFDGNIHSLGGNYGFDDVLNRAVAVDVRAITEALDKIYGARRILDEIRR